MKTRVHAPERLKRPGREVLTRQVEALDRRLAQVDDDLKQLDVRLYHHLRDDSYTARLVLRLPGQEIVARGAGPDQPVAIKEAFDRLADQIETLMSKLRREHAIRDEQRKPAWQTPPGVPMPEPD